MAATVLEGRLGIECVFSDGSRAVFTLDGVACPLLAGDLLTGLTELIHPHGSVDSEATVRAYVKAIRQMTGAFAQRGFPGGASRLSRAMLAGYWIGAGWRQEGFTRMLLRGMARHPHGSRLLGPQVKDLAAGRAFNNSPRCGVLPPYSPSEWSRLVTACEQATAESFEEHKRALASAGRGRDPREGGFTRNNALWLVTRLGLATKPQIAAHLGISAEAVRKDAGELVRARKALFPEKSVLVPYQLLFGARSGIVPDGIAGLRLGDIDWAGDAAVLLSYIKRRTGPESLNLPRRAVRLLEQWLSHSATLRRFVPDHLRDQLWITIDRADTMVVSAGRTGTYPIRGWAARHGVTSDDGGPLKIHRHRIRTTHQAMRDKRAWTGSSRAVIDPNHTPRVEGDHYLTADTPAQRRAVETIIEDAQHDLLGRASPPVVIGGHDRGGDAEMAELARDFPDRVGQLGITVDGTVLGELLSGGRDVFAAACADQLSGLHGPKGRPCPARPWVCLACPLAVFAPRHAASLLRLKAYFARQWQVMPSAHFMAVFGPYARRASQVLERFPQAVLAAAAGQVTGCDDELPLRPEERTR